MDHQQHNHLSEAAKESDAPYISIQFYFSLCPTIPILYCPATITISYYFFLRNISLKFLK